MNTMAQKSNPTWTMILFSVLYGVILVYILEGLILFTEWFWHFLALIVAVTMVVSMVLAKRNPEKLVKRATIAGFVMGLGVAMISSAYLIIDSFWFCSTECGWSVVFIPVLFIIGALIGGMASVMGLYFKKVNKIWIHVIILLLLVLGLGGIYLPSIIETGCLRWDAKCVFDRAIEEGQVEWCSHLAIFSPQRESCEIAVAKETGDVEICRKMESGEQKDRCLKSLATTLQDPEICKDASDNHNIAALCFSMVADDLMDETICQNIKDQLGEDRCVSNVAKKKADVVLCRGLVDTGVKDSCLSDVGRKLGDDKICDEIQNDGIRDFCFEDVAKGLRDKNVCNKIINDRRKESCLSFLIHGIQ